MSATGEPQPLVSIVIPTFNRCHPLRRLLEHLDRTGPQTPPFEVVVCVDGSTDDTLEMLHRLQTTYPLRVLVQANSGPAAARNRAVEVAVGEVVLFLDDDVLPVGDLVARHLELQAVGADLVVIGALLPPPERAATPWARWEAATLLKHCTALSEGRKKVTPHHFYTGNASVRREQIVALGGFTERYRRGEDVEFAYRLAAAKLTFRFAPRAGVIHESDHSLENWQRIYFHYGQHDVRMARDQGLKHALELSFAHPGGRHWIIRALTRWSIGHPRRLDLTGRVLNGVLSYRGPGIPVVVQRVACSLLATVRYWEGIAAESELGARVWTDLDPQHVRAASVPAGHSPVAA